MKNALFSDKITKTRAFFFVCTIVFWYSLFVPTVMINQDKFFYPSNLISEILFALYRPMGWLFLLATAMLIFLTLFNDKIYKATLKIIMFDLYCLIIASFLGYGIHSNANGSNSLNGLYIYDFIFSAMPHKITNDIMLWSGNNELLVGEKCFDFFVGGLSLSYFICLLDMQKISFALYEKIRRM